MDQSNLFAEGKFPCSLTSDKQFFSYEKMRPGILPEHGFKHKGNHYASLPWFGTKIAQKYAIQGSKYSGFRRDVKPHVLTFSTSGQRQVTTFCTCAVTSRKKCHVSGCRRQAGDVCCLRCLISNLGLPY